jgi:hypothetical protein
MKKGDIQLRVRSDMAILVWKDKLHIHMLINMHTSPEESNFCDKHGNGIMPAIVVDYNMHTEYVDTPDRMTNTYSISL